MNDIVIGPFAFPATLLLVFGAVFVTLGVAARLAKAGSADVERSLWVIAGLMVLGARLLFVLLYHPFYADEPLRILDIRDGGFAPAGGLAAVVVAGAWIAWRRAPQRRPLLVALAAGCMVWVAGTLALSVSRKHETMPDTVLEALDGGQVPLASLRGKPVVVNLWATWCPPCRREMPVLAKAQQQHPGVVFVFANQGEAAPVIRAYLAAEGHKLENVLLDRSGTLAQASGSRGLPTTLFYDASGALVERRMGELSAATLAQKLVPLESRRGAQDGEER